MLDQLKGISIKHASNLVAANTVNGSIPARPGFSVVILNFSCHARGGAAAANVEGTGSDTTHNFFACARSNVNIGTAPYGNTAQAELNGPKIFKENGAVIFTVNGNGAATEVGFSVAFGYIPVPLGFTGV
jgi:hypothetical protein